MPRSPTIRFLALLIGLAGAVAAPIAALAHGTAHQHEAAEHDLAAHDVAIAGHSDHGSGDHAHPNIGAARTSNVATALVPLVAQRVTFPSATIALCMPPIAPAAVEHRTQFAQAPPPRLRAPPA